MEAIRRRSVRIRTAAAFALAVVVSLVALAARWDGIGAPVLAADLSWPAYAEGADHANVRTIELVLAGRGYSGFDIDNYFGPNTTDEVKRFQRQNDIADTGIVGDVTWPVLVREVNRGDNGREVEALQRQLNQQGSNLQADGAFGEGTGAALIYYKSSRCLTISELAGDTVWHSLITDKAARADCFGDLPSRNRTENELGSLINNPEDADPPCTTDPDHPENNHDKPGAVGLANIITGSIPGLGSVGISRSCGAESCDAVGYFSEHCEGRAMDISFSSTDDADRARVRELLRWLMDDANGSGAKCDRARAFGLMYIIWDDRKFNFEADMDGDGCKASSGKTTNELSNWESSTWRDYSSACPGQDASFCHYNHVHISLTWPGARKNSAWWP